MASNSLFMKSNNLIQTIHYSMLILLSLLLFWLRKHQSKSCLFGLTRELIHTFHRILNLGFSNIQISSQPP
jgi:hypothetical protein